MTQPTRGCGLFVFLLLLTALNLPDAMASTADASATVDWTTLNISMTAVSGTPALTLITGTYAQHDYSTADGGGLSQTNDIYDWTSGTSARVASGLSYGEAATEPSTLSGSVHIDTYGQFHGQSTRSGSVLVTGGIADVTFSIDTHLADTLPPDATSYTVSVNASLTVQPSGGSAAIDNAEIFRYFGDGLPLAQDTLDKTLSATVRLGNVQSANFDISNDVQLTLFSPAPVPLPAGALLFGSGVLGLLATMRRRVAFS